MPQKPMNTFNTTKENQTLKQLLGYWQYDAINKTWIISDELKKSLHLNDIDQKEWFSHIHPDDLELVTSEFSFALQHKQIFQSVHRILIDDTWHWIRIRSRRDMDKDQFVGLIGTIEDITPQVIFELDHALETTQLKTEVNKLNQEIQLLIQNNKKTNDMKSSFLSSMSHEIRTPMNALIGFTHLLMETKLDHDQEEYVTRINDASTHLLSIINDILDLSKMEAGKMPIEKRSFHMDKLISDVKDLLTPSAQRKNLYFDIEKMKCSHALIGDSVRIKQILINLLSNAIKFTETGGVSLVISCEDQAHEKVTISFKVKDTGIGMTPEQQLRLFKDFEQADQSTSRLYGGTGLGLSISHKLATLMDGTITVDSRLNEGTTFTLILPLDLLKDDEEDVAPLVKHQPIKSNPHILVAEDHILSQKLTERLLQNLGAKVKLVDQGEKAVQAMKDDHFDLVFLDMNMPVLNGIQASEQIRRFNKKTPILALTANQYAEERAACLLAGMNDILIKPIDSKTLYEALVKWIPEE